jgi:hypothetical protein
VIGVAHLHDPAQPVAELTTQQPTTNNPTTQQTFIS